MDFAGDSDEKITVWDIDLTPKTHPRQMEDFLFGLRTGCIYYIYTIEERTQHFLRIQSLRNSDSRKDFSAMVPLSATC